MRTRWAGWLAGGRRAPAVEGEDDGGPTTGRLLLLRDDDPTTTDDDRPWWCHPRCYFWCQPTQSLSRHNLVVADRAAGRAAARLLAGAEKARGTP